MKPENSITVSRPQGHMTQPLNWIDAWINAITGPRNHFESLLHDTNSSINRALSWITLASAAGTILLVALVQQDELADLDLERIYGFPALLCVVPLGALIGLLLFALATGITHGLANLLGGSGMYDRLAYVIAAYSAPLLVLALLLAITGCLLPLALGLYSAVLNVLAVRAVYRLGWIRAALCGLWLPVLFAAGIILIVIEGSAAIRF